VTDADLVAKARQGDHAAFGELVDRHRRAVFRAAMAALGSHGEAEDAAQEACLLAWTRLGSFRGDAAFRTWLLTIAWRQAINQRRSLLTWWKRMVPFEAEPAEALAFVAPAPRTPEQRASAGELRQAVAAAIRNLSPKLRDTLLLALSGDYTYEEVGAMLGAPPGTIKWRVAEARRIVRNHLKAQGYAELG
jgi:RNA polymerase sigma-70 factor (ECF subfamily)